LNNYIYNLKHYTLQKHTLKITKYRKLVQAADTSSSLEA